MDFNTRQLHVNRIISGKTLIEVDGDLLEIRSPSAFDRYRADLMYRDTLRSALENGSLTDAELLDILKERGIWRADQQTLLDGLEKDVEKGKVYLYESRMDKRKVEHLREKLKIARSEIARLSGVRHSLDNLLASYVAHAARSRFLTAVSIFGADGRQLIFPNNYGVVGGAFPLDKIMEEVYRSQLSDEVIRELSHNEPWATTYRVSQNSKDPLFGVPAISYTEEQKSLLNWSSIYDSIRQHPECPTDEVINDTDMLDGWLILQRQKREEETFRASIEASLPENVAKSAEVFVVTGDSREDVTKLNSLNDKSVLAARRAKYKEIEKHGIIPEEQTSEAQSIMRKQGAQAIHNHFN